MSAVLSAVQICERALRAINAFPITDSSADGEQLREAMIWLDMILAENAGANKIFSLIPSPEQVFFNITNGTGNYDLTDALGANAPSDGVQDPLAAYIEFTNGDGVVVRHPIPIVPRAVYMSKRLPERNGRPEMVYIDRIPDNQLYIYPIPPSTDTNVYKLVLDVQTYAPNVAPAGVTGTQPQSEVITKFRQAWNRFFCFQLAHDLGSGPIFKLPEASLNRFGKVASTAKADLLAYENREHDDLPPIGEGWDSYDEHDPVGHGHHSYGCGVY